MQDPAPDSDLLVRGTDPRILIRTEMSRIRNTDILKIMDFFLQENNEDITHRQSKISRVQVREIVSLEEMFR